MLKIAPTFETGRHKCLIHDGHPSAQLPVVVGRLNKGAVFFFTLPPVPVEM